MRLVITLIPVISLTMNYWFGSCVYQTCSSTPGSNNNLTVSKEHMTMYVIITPCLFSDFHSICNNYIVAADSLK